MLDYSQPTVYPSLTRHRNRSTKIDKERAKTIFYKLNEKKDKEKYG